MFPEGNITGKVMSFLCYAVTHSSTPFSVRTMPLKPEQGEKFESEKHNLKVKKKLECKKTEKRKKNININIFVRGTDRRTRYAGVRVQTGLYSRKQGRYTGDPRIRLRHKIGRQEGQREKNKKLDRNTRSQDERNAGESK